MRNSTRNFVFKPLGFLFIALISFSCIDTIPIDLDKGPERLVVDGWLHQNITSEKNPMDTIKLRWTSEYFNNSASPRATGALVTISDNTGLLDTLVEVSPGNYLPKNTVREMGRSYKLTIQIKGETYEAFTTMRTCPPIDSLKAIFRKKAQGPQDTGFYLYYFGPENEGSGDYYRFKTYQNGRFLNTPSDLAFTDDQFLKEVVYIDSLEINFQPFNRGDVIRVETLSISEDMFYFFTELQAQINNAGLFAQPPSNVRTNVKNKNPKGPPAQGYFGASGLSSYEVVCE
jgi:hypothetical protein